MLEYANLVVKALVSHRRYNGRLESAYKHPAYEVLYPGARESSLERTPEAAVLLCQHKAP